MNPRVETINDKNGNLTFKLSGVNVSIANAIRRTILSDIPTVVFITTPYEKCRATFTANTSRLNNEILNDSSTELWLIGRMVNYIEEKNITSKTSFFKSISDLVTSL